MLQALSRQQDHQGLAVRGGQQSQSHRLHIAGHCCLPNAAAIGMTVYRGDVWLVSSLRGYVKNFFCDVIWKTHATSLILSRWLISSPTNKVQTHQAGTIFGFYILHKSGSLYW